MVIKDLVEKAKISVPSGLTPDEWIDRYNEILVGLVVKECANSLSKLDSSVFAEFDRHDAAKRVLNTFGDEE